jgi:hypothetical protein
MEIDRRGFLRGIAATMAFVAVPASVVKIIAGPEATQAYCTQKLLKMWLVASKGQGTKPINFECGRQFFEAFEGELLPLQRFVSNAEPPIQRHLMFKAGKVVQNGEGWWVRYA